MKNTRGFQHIRETLAQNYDLASAEPDIQVVDVDLLGDRLLKLQHTKRNGVPLDPDLQAVVLAHVKNLWGYDVSLQETAD